MIGPPREMSLTSLMTRRRVCLACRIAAAPSVPPPARCASRAPVGLVAMAIMHRGPVWPRSGPVVVLVAGGGAERPWPCLP